MTQEDLVEMIREVGPWFHSVEVAEGVFTREIAPAPGPQPVDHPLQRWSALEPHLPENMEGLKVLDIGSADGFFSVEFAKRGAQVLAVDAAPKMIERVRFLAEHMGLPIETRVGVAETFSQEEHFDIVFNLGLLYHSRHPLLLLEQLAPLAPVMYVETTITSGDQPLLYLKPPLEAVHHIPKWFPTKSVVIEMLKLVGFSNFEIFDYQTKNRFFLKARKP